MVRHQASQSVHQYIAPQKSVPHQPSTSLFHYFHLVTSQSNWHNTLHNYIHIHSQLPQHQLLSHIWWVGDFMFYQLQLKVLINGGEWVILVYKIQLTNPFCTICILCITIFYLIMRTSSPGRTASLPTFSSYTFNDFQGLNLTWQSDYSHYTTHIIFQWLENSSKSHIFYQLCVWTHN